MTASNIQNPTVQKVVERISNSQAKEFARILYSEVSNDDIANIDADHLAKAALSTFKLFTRRDKTETLINLYRPHDESDMAILEIVNLDVPFLIDSITNELKSQQHEIHLIVHPTMRVKRDGTGKFIDFDSEGSKEDVMQYHLSNWNDKEKDAQLIARVKKIMECINFAVSDWRKMTARMTECIDVMRESTIIKRHEMRDESIAFLEWLVANHMVFLGCVDYELKGNLLVPVIQTELGVIRSDHYQLGEILVDENVQTHDPLIIRKWDQKSIVHRTAHLDQIIIKSFDNRGRVSGAMVFFGLYTSSVYYQSVRNIPLMRKKVQTVIQRYGYPEASHNCKELITAMESFPRGELLQMSIDDLYNTATGIVSLSLIPRIKVFMRKDQYQKFISCIIFIPDKKFSTEARTVIEDIVLKHIGGSISKRYVQIGESALARLQLMISTAGGKLRKINPEVIERDIVKALTNWHDELNTALQIKYPKRLGVSIFQKYRDAFDVKYRANFAGSQAVHDIRMVEEAISLKEVRFDLYISSKGEGGKDFIQLKIYSPQNELALSSTLPIIENLGLFALEVQTYQVNPDEAQGKVFIHHFRLTTRVESLDLDVSIQDSVKEALEQIWAKRIDDDEFNSLILTAGLSWREANMLRAYFKYLKQTNFTHGQHFTLEALTNNRAITYKLVRLFNLKFDASKKLDLKHIEKEINEIKNDLDNIKSVQEDRIVRSYLQVILATKRTNFFQLDEQGRNKDYVSFKIASAEVLDLPNPRPFREIFVYSTRFEAIHLRGGKVARGGLRWSDRKEDFRTEVLGLMKAQMTKNSVIVPVGSKGGFVLKKVTPAHGRDEFMNEGVACYKLFLSGLLDITDNIVDGKIVAPKSVVRHDEDDPYLVVAADKGTATFSDYANSVSEQYGFWLGDAFASGGSAGYDHKKMGITARGGWICVEGHFEAMGIDISKQEFTCVGIGDMSGDVFGNGMLLSKCTRMIAAFNHAHIFIDPNPDAAKSFAERKRLFDKPRSQWTDYDSKLISKGGAIFDRKEKLITISVEAQKALGVTESKFTPDDLIKAILTAPVDLLWNGGIGTYVKAKTQTHEQIGDKSNDALRINGGELRCKVVGEGGNLGFTQLGRIEYSKNGGRINTDFIDNSAGVDCSDHEVNLKIATSDEMRAGRIKRADRDKLLEKMTDDVAQLVLQDNYKQSQILTIEQANRVKVNSHAWLIRFLESRSELDRNIEFLPSQEDMAQLISDKHGLTRPELAVLLAYAKNSIYAMLVKQDFSQDKFFAQYLHNYFPTAFKKQFPALIENHKLKNEIIATVLTNDFVNMMGCTFFHQMYDDTGVAPLDIIKAFVIARESFKIDQYWHAIETLDAATPSELRINLFNRIQTFMERNILWLLKHGQIGDLDKTIKDYNTAFSTIAKKIHTYVSSAHNSDFEARIAPFEGTKKLHEVARSVFTLKLMLATFDIYTISKAVKKDLESTAKIYFQVGEKMHLRWLITQARSFVPRQYVQIVAMRMLIGEMQDVFMKLTTDEIKGGQLLKSCHDDKSDLGHKYKKYNAYIDELKEGDTSDAFVSKLTIAVSKVKLFVE